MALLIRAQNYTLHHKMNEIKQKELIAFFQQNELGISRADKEMASTPISIRGFANEVKATNVLKSARRSIFNFPLLMDENPCKIQSIIFVTDSELERRTFFRVRFSVL